jgi:FkbM family methyltransferase
MVLSLLKWSLRKVLPFENYMRLVAAYHGKYDYAIHGTLDEFINNRFQDIVKIPNKIKFPFCEGKPYAARYQPKDPNNRMGHEPELTNLLSLFLKGNGVMFDVGANTGYVSLYASHLEQFSGQIHAFEPLTSMCDQIKEVIGQNEFSSDFFLHQVAISDTAGRLKIGWDDDTGLASLNTPNLANSEIVKVAPLDNIELPLPTFLKIDTEGHELAALNGAKKLISKAKPAIFIETTLTSSNVISALEPLALLEDWGYQLYLPCWMQEQGKVHIGIGPDFSFDEPALIPFEFRERILFPGEAINIFAVSKSFDFSSLI